MGTIVDLTVVCDSAAQAEDAFAAALSEMDRLIKIFDRHQSGTALSELNDNGRLSDPGPEMLEVLEMAGRVHKLSDRAFDPTILPLLSLIENSFSATGQPPARADLDEALKNVDFSSVRYGKSGVNLASSSQKISLDGLAKGYIVDRAGAKLVESGIRNALINAGGDILALGGRENGKPWRVGIQDPFQRDKYLRVITLSDQAVATSGSYEIFFDSDKKYHHILNPRLGLPENRLVSATVIAVNTAQADANSTAAFINARTLDVNKYIEGMTIAANGRPMFTAGFKRHLTI